MQKNYLKERYSRFFSPCTSAILPPPFFRKGLISLKILTEKTLIIFNAVTLLCYFSLCQKFYNPLLFNLVNCPLPRRFVKEFERIKENIEGDTDHSVTCDKALVKSGQIEHGYFRNLIQVVCFEK